MFSVNQTTIEYDPYNDNDDETNLKFEEVGEETIGMIN